MNIKFAETLANKMAALKHCKKRCEEIEKKGKTIIRIGAGTHVDIVVNKGDINHLMFLEKAATLEREIREIQILDGVSVKENSRRGGRKKIVSSI